MLRRKCGGDSLETSECFSVIIKQERQGVRENVLPIQMSMIKTLWTKIIETGNQLYLISRYFI